MYAFVVLKLMKSKFQHKTRTMDWASRNYVRIMEILTNCCATRWWGRARGIVQDQVHEQFMCNFDWLMLNIYGSKKWDFTTPSCLFSRKLWWLEIATEKWWRADQVKKVFLAYTEPKQEINGVNKKKRKDWPNQYVHSSNLGSNGDGSRCLQNSVVPSRKCQVLHTKKSILANIHGCPNGPNLYI